MYFLAKQRDTIARTLEPTREQDSRNVLGPTKDHRPCCWVPVHGRYYSIKFSHRRWCGAKVQAGNQSVAGRTLLGDPVHVLLKHDNESIRDCIRAVNCSQRTWAFQNIIYLYLRPESASRFWSHPEVAAIRTGPVRFAVLGHTPWLTSGPRPMLLKQVFASTLLWC